MSSGKRHLFRWFGKETPRFGTNCFSSEFICFADHLSKQQKQRFQTRCMAHNQPAKALWVHFIKYATWAMFICFSDTKNWRLGTWTHLAPSQHWVLSLCRCAGETAIPCGPRLKPKKKRDLPWLRFEINNHLNPFWKNGWSKKNTFFKHYESKWKQLQPMPFIDHHRSIYASINVT